MPVVFAPTMDISFKTPPRNLTTEYVLVERFRLSTNGDVIASFIGESTFSVIFDKTGDALQQELTIGLMTAHAYIDREFRQSRIKANLPVLPYPLPESTGITGLVNALIQGREGSA